MALRPRRNWSPDLGSGDSSFAAGRRVRVPSPPGFGLHLGETGARRRIGYADEMLAGGTLNLTPRVARLALQRLITVGTVKFELSCAHNLDSDYAPTGYKKYSKKCQYFSDQTRVLNAPAFYPHQPRCSSRKPRPPRPRSKSPARSCAMCESRKPMLKNGTSWWVRKAMRSRPIPLIINRPPTKP
jgi:hypothetical protein